MEAQEKSKQQLVDFNYIADKGFAEYTDGDIMVLDQVGLHSLRNDIKIDMIILLFCTEGRLQFEMNDRTYIANKGNVVIGLPKMVFSNYMMSPDFKSNIIALSYSAAQRNMQINKDSLDLMQHVASNPVIEIDADRQELVSKYYSIIEHKVKNPHGYFHKEIMRSIFSCAVYELFAIIAPHVSYSNDGGSMKQANLLFKRFADLINANNGKVRSVKSYAEEMCITPKYLSFVSKTVTGRTALEWIHTSTVRAIERYLRHSNLSIKEIADQLDFPNLSFFGKFTKSHLGVSPTEYRRMQSMKRL